MPPIKALTFDTGGTILDWHGGLVRAFVEVGGNHGVTRDWPALVNEYRRRTLGGIVNAVRPAYNFDDVHARVMDELCAEHQLTQFSAAERTALWRTMHSLEVWPDFVPGLVRLRKKFPCVSFTLLTTALVINVSRANNFTWDAVISCEMIGTYKTKPEAYLTAAKWLQLMPAEILMVACHNFDLNAAKGCGYQTAFVRRPLEWGPGGPPDPTPNPIHDIIVDTFPELAARLGA
jgi:2-haloacid dehalogenase